MAGNVFEEHTEELLRTVEMFEAITQSQPDDYQSLEILKETYGKLHRRQDRLRTSKRLARAYVSLGQISQAILEYESILQEQPNDAEARAALDELEAKTSQFSAANHPGAPSLAEDSKPRPPASTRTVEARAPLSLPGSRNGNDGARALAEVLIAEKLVTPQAVEPLLKRLAAEGPASIEKAQPLTLVQLLVDEQIAKLEDILCVLVDRSGLPYLPLSIYDVDRDAACLLPKEVCFGHCIVPFDVISRSVLVATANPFDAHARNDAELMLPYNIFWYITSPGEIIAALRRVHALDAKPAARTQPKP